MIASPLQLDRYFLTRVDLSARMPSQIDEGSAEKISVSTTIEASKGSEDSLEYEIGLAVELAGNGTYFGHVDVLGFVRIDESIDAERRDGLVVVNGAAVLFGVVREVVANFTARGPWGEVLLPLGTFIDQKDQPVEIREPASTAS